MQLEVINPSYWPDFPWRALDASYDVWLPMAYWTVRTVESGYRDSYRYAEESTRRMRNNIGRPDVIVHIIGGIGDETTTADLDGLRRAVEDTGSDRRLDLRLEQPARRAPAADERTLLGLIRADASARLLERARRRGVSMRRAAVFQRRSASTRASRASDAA